MKKLFAFSVLFLFLGAILVSVPTNSFSKTKDCKVFVLKYNIETSPVLVKSEFVTFELVSEVRVLTSYKPISNRFVRGPPNTSLDMLTII